MSEREGKWRALAGHCGLMLRLNFRSPQAIVYGYLVPVIFLVAFGSVFRGERPALWHEMGQVLTISLLGGACFGFPTALVAERERGVWRRYQLLPMAAGWLLMSAVMARLILVASMVAVQIGLARLLYGTPWPVHPGGLAVGFLFVAAALLGLGLVVAAVAENVPAVQALGQCLFLPMVLIGGVGVPLAVLPEWAQRLAAFMPGRHAVEVLQACYSDPRGLRLAGVSLGALGLIGAAAGIAGVKLFRWGPERTRRRGGWRWLLAAGAAWGAAGVLAIGSGRALPVVFVDSTWETITPEQIAAIRYDDLPGDAEFATRLSPRLTTREGLVRARAIEETLRKWKPAAAARDDGERARLLVAAAALVDVARDEREGDFARVVFDTLQTSLRPAELERVLAWIALEPGGGEVALTAPELGVERSFDERVVRERSALYARKFLGRVLGKIDDP